MIEAIITIMGVMIGNATMVISMFLWVRSESRADARHTDAKLESTRDLVRAIHDEVQDFHKQILKK